MSDKKLTILVATHKKYKMPDDRAYQPVLVGATFMSEDEKKECKGYLYDDEGDNISSLNKSFCELTGLYYAWKNLDSDYIGIVHYRRYFAKRFKFMGDIGDVMSGDEIEELLGKYKLIVPRKQRYYIETMYSHYAHTHYSIHLDETRNIINSLCPEYINSFDKVMNNRSAYMFNMAIMSKQMFDEYSKWLYPILFKLQDELSMPELSNFHGRYYGRVAEIIFNVWISHKIEIGELNREDIKELPIVYLEKINWLRKIKAFLGAKFFHKKYSGSF